MVEYKNVVVIKHGLELKVTFPIDASGLLKNRLAEAGLIFQKMAISQASMTQEVNAKEALVQLAT